MKLFQRKKIASGIRSTSPAGYRIPSRTTDASAGTTYADSVAAARLSVLVHPGDAELAELIGVPLNREERP